MISRRFVVGSLLAVGLIAPALEASSYSDAVIANGPVGYWRLDETELPTATNVGSGASIDATYMNVGAGSGPNNIGQVGPRPGDLAGGYLIDGLEAANKAMHLAPISPGGMNLFPRAEVAETFDGYPLDIIATPPFGTGVTLEAWVRRDPQTNAGNNEGIVGKFQGSTFGDNRSYELYYDPRSGGRVGFVVNSTGASAGNFEMVSPTDIPVDQWVHLAATYEPSISGMPASGRTAIYVNGQLAIEKTGATNAPEMLFDSAAPLWIGQQFSDDPSTTFEGRIDEVAVYDKALTAGQIAAHFDAATANTLSVSSWVPNASGSWHTAANWKSGSVPNSNTAAIEFGPAITASKVVYTESPVTVKSIRFDTFNGSGSTVRYAIAGLGALTLAADSGNAQVQVARGNQEFQLPVKLGSNTDVTVTTGATNSLSFNNVLNLSGKTLQIVSGTVNFNNAVLPGAGGQVANIGGNMGAGSAADFGGDFFNGGTLNVDIGGAQPGEYSVFSFAGTAILGGVVSAQLSNDFELTPGDTFTVLTAGNLVDNGISLSGPLADELHLNVVENNLVLSAGLLGDFNGNGTVDGADYLTWRKELGTRFTQNDYGYWRANFGASTGFGGGRSLAVPEPSSLWLLLVGGALATLLQVGPRVQRRGSAKTLVAGLPVVLAALVANTAEAGPYSSAVLADGPVAYYQLGETSGSVAINSSTNGAALDGSYTNFGAAATPQSSIGQLGPRPGDISGSSTIQGMESDNIGIRSAANATAQVEVPDNNLLDITGALTLEAWVRRDDAQVSLNNNEGIVGKFVGSPAGTNERSYVLYYNPRTSGTNPPALSLGFVVNTTGASGGNVDFNTGVNLPSGTAAGWTYLAAVFEPGVRMSVYMNGVSIGEKTTGVPSGALYSGAAPLWIGRQFSAATNTSFEGLMDEVAVYDKALTPAQILAHYSAAANNTPATFDWVPNSSGTWHSTANWSPSANYVPSGTQISINFGSAITAPKVVYTESGIFAKSISFDNNNKYAIAGVGTITMAANSGNAAVQVVHGNHEFQTAISLGSNTDLTVASGAGNSLSFNNALTLNAKTLSIQSGAVNINHSIAAGTGGAGIIINGADGVLGTAGATPIAGTFSSLGTLDIDLGGTETNQFSQFNITGTATVSGLISPELVNGFTLSSGNTFTILSATSLTTGSLSLTGPLASSLALTKVGDTLVLTATGLSGDFNHDNKVDAADYVTWRKGLGTTFMPSDYDVWRQNFGATGGSGAGTLESAAVPEPGVLALLVAAAGPMLIGRVRKFRR